ncbi:TetR/AcrR family transcriptional regulator [Cohnella hongkongensis]|uniref:TetR/AcrR family transcriptional regulator n=1 Tax=Cohnella hongkongensis TaxID=178337 RepID=A0ABV9F8I9_9BACL
MSPHEEVAASRKEQILISAAALFASQGYYKTTTAHVAEAVGVTQPYVFHFFKSKEQLYLAVLEKAFDRMMSQFFSVSAPADRLSEEMGKQFDLLLRTHRNEMLLLMQSFTTPEPAVRQFTKEKYSLIYDRLVDRFTAVRAADPQWQASQFIACGLIGTLAEVLELPKLAPWCDSE